VRDTGIGIEPSERAALFEPYYQTDRERSGAGSLGFGLALVKALVRLHGGTVEASSAGLHRGSEFAFTLPLAETAGRPEPTPQRPTPAPRRILVVDDQRDNADTFAAMLRLLGQQVQVAYSGEEALATARQHRPEVAFLDLSMPRMDGRELARQLRQLYPPAELTLIALTGYARAIDAPGDPVFQCYLLKPATLDAVAVLLSAPRGDGSS
jgi:CheY-like chemotaxis protein